MIRYNTDIALFEVYQNGSWETASIGNAGGLLGIGEYRYESSVTPPPSSARFRFDNSSPASATKFYVHYFNQAGTDLTNVWKALTPSSIIYVQERTNANNGFFIRVASYVDQGTYLEVNIQQISVSGTISTGAKYNVILSYLGSNDFQNKSYARVATTGNITLSAPGSTIDGITMASGDRVLVWKQTTASENGIYIWNGAATAMTRALDADTWDEIRGRRIYVVEGTQYANSTWENNSAYTGTVDSTSMTWTGSLRRIGPNGRFDLGDSWTATRANSAFGPRVLTLIDTKAVMRLWRYVSDGSNPGMELIYGTNDDAANTANEWWDLTLNEPPNAGIRISRRTGSSFSSGDIKVFASTTGVRIGPTCAETNPAVALSVDATDAMLVPVGTTAQQPTGVNGYLRYNSTNNKFEVYENSAWRNLTTGGQGSLQLYAENPTGTPVVSATGTNSSAFGDGAAARLYGSMADSSGNFAAAGDAQVQRLVARAVTTNATPATVFLDGAAATQRMVLQNNSAWTFEIDLVARNTGANQAAGYRFVGVIRRDGTAASTTFVGTPSKTVLGENNASWDANVTADTTNGALNLSVTGVAATTIRWVASIRLTEVLV